MNSDCLSALQTCDQIIRLKIPNLLRLYLNPFVAQTCMALAEMVPALWPKARAEGRRPSFLANSGEEALSGALKLARYTQNIRSQKLPALENAGRFSTAVYLVDDGLHFKHFASTEVIADASGRAATVEFIPQMFSLKTSEFLARVANGDKLEGILVLSPRVTDELPHGNDFWRSVRQFCDSGRSLVISCVDRERFAEGMRTPDIEFLPDIVVFDESFTKRQVPFGAFTARRELFAHWTTKGMTNFHSTTFQPNTISSMHFLKCLQDSSEIFFHEIQPQLKPLLVNHKLLMGFCQYEPNILKFTPPLTVTDEEVAAVCKTVAETLKTSTVRLLSAGISALWRGKK